VPEIATRLESDSGLSWRVQRRSGRWGVGVDLSPKGVPGWAILPGAKPEDAATAFLRKYGSTILSMQDALHELSLKEAGAGRAAFQQAVNGVPVPGGSATFFFSAAGDLSSVHSFYVSGIRDMSTTPALDANAAILAAQADMPKQYPAGALGAALPTKSTTLEIRPILQTHEWRLVYNLVVRYAGQWGPVGRYYVIDAQTGGVVASDSGIRY
jgi:Zn-dependent metalloprotease